jgi:hypothetical protein
MKTPTLIVRLVGLYLLLNGVIALLQVQKMEAMQVTLPGMPVQQNGVFGDVQLYAGISVFAGLALAVFAGRLAELLTFDSSPREKAVDLSDQLLGRKDSGV